MIEDFKKRLIVEVRELSDRVNKLSAFINGNPKFKELDDRNRELMDKHLHHMTGYLECLNERISDLVTSEEINEYDANIYKDLTFGEALSYIKDYKVLRRKGWNGKGLVVFRQVPAHIEEEIIPKMQSLPDDAKKVILSTRKHIDYTSQMLIYNTETARADSWVPSVSDTLAEDWEVVDVDNL